MSLNIVFLAFIFEIFKPNMFLWVFVLGTNEFVIGSVPFIDPDIFDLLVPAELSTNS